MIPLIYIIGVGVASLLGGGAVINLFKNKDRLGILGMQASGKTRFLSFIRKIPFVEISTSRSQYEEFKYTLANGKSITIKSGVDMGGGIVYRVDYDKIINESDVILYFFDINRYLNNAIDGDNENYQRSCNSRFEHIYSRVLEEKKNVVIIATHRDKYPLSENEIKQKFDNLVQAKSYKSMLKNVQYVNLTSPKEISNLVEKIFNSKK